MSLKKITGRASIDSAIAAIHKKYKKELLFDTPPKELRPVIPTGSFKLDMATGIGGIPVGTIIEIFGPESSGKTSLCMQIAKKFQDVQESLGLGDKLIAIIDLERSTDYKFMTGFGIDDSKIIYSKPDTAEEAFEITRTLAQTGEVGLIIFDSIDAAQSETQLSGDVGDKSYGGIGLITSKFFREFSKIVEATQCTALFINQEREQMGMGAGKTTSGGKALKYYAKMRIKLWVSKPGQTPGTFVFRAQFVKNKCAPPRKEETETEFLYAKGFDPAAELIEAAKELKIGYYGGGQFKVYWKDGEDAEFLANGGKLGAIEALNQDPELFARLENLCKQKLQELVETE